MKKSVRGLTQQEVLQIKDGPEVETTATTMGRLRSRLYTNRYTCGHIMCLNVGFPCVYVNFMLCSKVYLCVRCPNVCGVEGGARPIAVWYCRRDVLGDRTV